MSDTPRTDAVWSCPPDSCGHLALIRWNHERLRDLSHELERELAAVTAERDALKVALEAHWVAERMP